METSPFSRINIACCDSVASILEKNCIPCLDAELFGFSAVLWLLHPSWLHLGPVRFCSGLHFLLLLSLSSLISTFSCHELSQ